MKDSEPWKCRQPQDEVQAQTQALGWTVSGVLPNQSKVPSQLLFRSKSWHIATQTLCVAHLVGRVLRSV